MNEKEISRIEITDTEEVNKDLIKEMFAGGMNTDEFLKAINKEENYIKASGKYEPINYNFEDNLTYSEIEEFLLRLNKSDIVKLEKIGVSHDKRPLYNLEIGKGTKTIIIDANMHAAEVGGTYFVMKFAFEIVNKYELGDKEILDLLNNIKIAILPSDNPDGFDMTQFGANSIKDTSLWVHKYKDEINFSQIKSNANGVDLNRNFPTQNMGLYYTKYNLIGSVALKKTPAMYIHFGGDLAGSEPETKSMMYFFAKHYKNAYSHVNIHSAGRVVYVGKPNLSDEYNDLCQKQGKIIKDVTKYRLYTLKDEEVGEGNDGTASDFMGELANGFLFSTKTKRLSKGNYDEKQNQIKYKYCSSVLETLGSYSQNIGVIKDEYVYRNFYKMFIELAKQGI